jgi:hypothetical protein
MKEKDKLRALIPHWISHNQEHAEEYQRWGEKTAGVAVDEILLAAETVAQVNLYLQQALEKLGGPLVNQHHHH